MNGEKPDSKLQARLGRVQAEVEKKVSRVPFWGKEKVASMTAQREANDPSPAP